jgi:hypothetical protein
MNVSPANFIDRLFFGYQNAAALNPVWFDYTDGKIRINSKKGRVKTRNMREGAPVALAGNGIWPHVYGLS